MHNGYRICTRCIMDTSDPEINFDEKGLCNHCKKYDEIVKECILPPEERKKRLQTLFKKIKEKGKNKKYDCIIGVSGGVDSTYTAYLVREFGLRPLAVHLDNGWDSELAVDNIDKALKKLDIDLYTYIIDWEEFRDLQLAFLRASTPDVEIPTDHAIIAILFRVSAKENVPYIIEGGNVVTEIIMPLSWSRGYRDWKYIKNIHKKFGSITLRTFPHLNLAEFLYYAYLKNNTVFCILDFIDYNKREAKKILVEKLGWRDYGGKHYESIYTRFCQGYLLPRKFGFDKRRAHLSCLICSGQISREDALQEIGKDPYESEDMKRQDKEYVIKKLGFTEKEFEEIIALPPKKHTEYPCLENSLVYKLLRFPYRVFKKGRRACHKV